MVRDTLVSAFGVRVNRCLFVVCEQAAVSDIESNMKKPRHFEELEVSDSWCSPGRTITEADIVNFAGMSGDYDPLHVDHEVAGASIYRKPIAHGLLAVAIMAGLSSRHPWVRTLAFSEIREWKFLCPTYIGDTLHVVTEVTNKRRAGRRGGVVTWFRRLINQDGTTVQQGILETLVATSVIPKDAPPRSTLTDTPKSS